MGVQLICSESCRSLSGSTSHLELPLEGAKEEAKRVLGGREQRDGGSFLGWAVLWGGVTWL